jgi:hypothetical protein|tara:strand:+ start:4043 stop:4435 length:393 start_codon:yes stop_codon:yes gene_type:complete
MTKIAKGSLVRLNKNICFTTRNGGMRKYPMTNGHNDDAKIVESHRPTTREEQEAWYNSPASKGMNSAGESKLPPSQISIPIHQDRVYTVLRARCRVRLGWGNPTPGLAMILCTETGEETYVKRDLLEVAV